MNYCVKLNHTLVENIENYDETDILDNNGPNQRSEW